MSEYKPVVMPTIDPYRLDEINLQIRAYKHIRDNTNYVGARDIHFGVWAGYYNSMDIDGMIDYLEEQKRFIENIK